MIMSDLPGIPSVEQTEIYVVVETIQKGDLNSMQTRAAFLSMNAAYEFRNRYAQHIWATKDTEHDSATSKLHISAIIARI